MPSFIKIAHRGASGTYPENSRVAFQKAIEARADMIELDCQLSQDGHVVVFHDEKLARITKAAGAVGQRSLAQLKQLDVGGWLKSKFRGERIQTLEEVLALINGSCRLCIDIKQFSRSPAGIEIKLLFILSHFDYLDRVIFSSFDYRCLGQVRELAPQVRIGLIYGNGVTEDPFVVAGCLRATSIHVQKEMASREFLQRAWHGGLDVFVWTVNDVSTMERFASLGVQGIFSDFPERFGKVNRS